MFKYSRTTQTSIPRSFDIASNPPAATSIDIITPGKEMTAAIKPNKEVTRLQTLNIRSEEMFGGLCRKNWWTYLPARIQGREQKDMMHHPPRTAYVFSILAQTLLDINNIRLLSMDPTSHSWTNATLLDRRRRDIQLASGLACRIITASYYQRSANFG